jgi:ABC-2 type transport system permease protein
MKEGEKLSAVTYKKHNNMLIQKYTDQQNFLKFTAFLNPYIAIKNISMALTATDFYSFIDFQNQAEKFRYQLAQNLNELQIKYISNEVKNSADKKAKLSHKIWLKMPDFKHSFASIKSAISSEIISFLALFFWGMILFVPIVNANKWFNKL